jgi:hypothetical protein
LGLIASTYVYTWSGDSLTIIILGPSGCIPPLAYQLGGTITGLRVAANLTLLNNGANPATFSQTGAFSFPGGIPSGSSYNVTVGSQPPGKTCSVANGRGVANNNVNNLEVRCVNNLYRIGGTVTGLAAGQRVRLVNNGVESLLVSANGAFTFLQGAAWNGRYNVIVGIQPTTQTCTVTGGTGFNVRSNVTNIFVRCSGETVVDGQTLPRNGLITAPRGRTTLYQNINYVTAPGQENTARIAIAALTNVRLTYPDFFNDRVTGKHELIGGLEVQGYAADYIATSHYGMVTLVQKTTGQIAYQVTRPQPGPNNSGINVDFLDGSIGLTSHLTPPLPDLPNGRWTMWITRGGVGTEGWGTVPAIQLLPENPVDLGQVGEALNPNVNSQDIDWGAVQ